MASPNFTLALAFQFPFHSISTRIRIGIRLRDSNSLTTEHFVTIGEKAPSSELNLAARQFSSSNAARSFILELAASQIHAIADWVPWTKQHTSSETSNSEHGQPKLLTEPSRSGLHLRCHSMCAQRCSTLGQSFEKH